jgi:glutamyl-tRNA reductase
MSAQDPTRGPAGFFVIGATHRTAPLAVREQLALATKSPTELHTELAAITEVSEFTVLSTCNRLEYYGIAADDAAIERAQAAFCALQGFDPAEFQKFRLRLGGQEALLHLLEVASGLDSQMLGETEIFGQVKEAYAAAQAGGFTGPALNRIFQKTFQAAKQVRTQTAITSGHVSVANVAVDLALTIFGSLAEARILVLGTGDIGEKTARAFKSRGAAALAVASRRFERAADLAAELGAAALAFEERETRLGEFDVVVCSTAAPSAVIDRSITAAAMRRRPARPLFLIDLAFPRDVEPAVADLENVFLYNLDDLAKIAEENRVAREAEISRCRALLAERAERLWQHIEELLTGGRGERAPHPASGAPSGPTPASAAAPDV